MSPFNPSGVPLPTMGDHEEPLKRFRADVRLPPLWSGTARWQDLVQQRHVPPLGDQAAGWASEWTVTYRHGKDRLKAPVASVGVNDLLTADPVRVNSWYPGKTARAGLRYVHSTGYHHAHESLFERKMLCVLDFGEATAIASQPFTLTWHDGTRRRHHTPDFIVEVDNRIVVVNTRPLGLVRDRLVEDASAVGEVCMSRGWDHVLVVGYPLPAFTTVDAIEPHAMAVDHLGYTEPLLDLLAQHGRMPFEEVCRTFDAPVLARALLQHLIWERMVSIDLNAPLVDQSLVALPGREVQP